LVDICYTLPQDSEYANNFQAPKILTQAPIARAQFAVGDESKTDSKKVIADPKEYDLEP